MEWISVTDRLPTSYDNVLVWALGYHDEPFVACYINGQWLDPDLVHDRNIREPVTHWMPLPEQPIK